MHNTNQDIIRSHKRTKNWLFPKNIKINKQNEEENDGLLLFYVTNRLAKALKVRVK